MELRSRAPQRPLVELAAQNHFTSEAAFSRAFRRQFGLSPDQAREIALSAQMPESVPRPLAIRWIRELGASVSAADR
jgi:AraC-like DNA-binding protein